MTEVNSAPATAMWRPATAVRWRAAAAWAGVAAVVGGAVTIAVSAAGDDLIVDTASAQEPGWVAGVFSGAVAGLTNTAFSVALLAMLVGYVAMVALAEWLEPRLVVAALGVAVVALVVAPVVLSSDLFGYIGYGRLGVVHGLNPYRHGVISAGHDPVLPLIYWQHPSSPYGPLFTLGSYLLAAHSLPTQVWAFKALGGLAWAASVAAVWWAAQARGARTPLRAAVLVGANPLLLVYGVGGGHNDLIVMAIVSGALALLCARRGRTSGVALAAAVAVKVTGGLALPFVLLGSRARRDVALGAACAGSVLVALTLAVFGTHVLDTVGAIATRPSFAIDWSGPDAIGRLLGTGISSGVRLGGLFLVLAVAAVSAAAVARRGYDWMSAAGWSALALLCALASFVPWYVAWLLPFAALGRSRALRTATLVLTAAVIATHLPLLGFAPYE